MTRPIKLFLQPLIKNAFQKRGFSSAQLIFDWEKIMGKSVADYSWPMKIVFAPNRRSHGTLHLNVLSSWATLVDQNRELYMERINTFFGYACVAQLKLHQRSHRQTKSTMDMVRPLTKNDQTQLDTSVEGLTDDDPLRTSLLALGEAIYGRNIK